MWLHKLNKLKPILAIIIMGYLLFLTLNGCKVQPNPIFIDGSEAVLDLDSKTIAYKGSEYMYQTDANSVMITYPNSVIYERVYQGTGYTESLSDGSDLMNDSYFTKNGFLTPYVIINQILAYSPNVSDVNTSSGMLPILGFIALIIGIGTTASPKTAWYLRYGWRFKDAEPSEASLMLNRVGGVVTIIVSGIILLSSL